MDAENRETGESPVLSRNCKLLLTEAQTIDLRIEKVPQA